MAHSGDSSRCLRPQRGPRQEECSSGGESRRLELLLTRIAGRTTRCRAWGCDEASMLWLQRRGIAGATKRRRRSLTRAPRPALYRRRIWSAETSPRGCRVAGWSGTSATCPPPRAGCSWPPCSTLPPVKWLATRWPSTCAPPWSATRCGWPPAAAGCTPAQSSTPTGVPSTPRPSSGICWHGCGSGAVGGHALVRGVAAEPVGAYLFSATRMATAFVLPLSML